MKLILRSSVVWLCFLLIAFMNGGFRELILIKRIGISPHFANQLSCYTGATLWTILLIFLWKNLAIKNMTQSLLVGLSWLLVTALFETFVMNRNLSWDEIAQTYNVIDGEFWGLVLIWLAFLPSMFFVFSSRVK